MNHDAQQKNFFLEVSLLEKGRGCETMQITKRGGRGRGEKSEGGILKKGVGGLPVGGE